MKKLIVATLMTSLAGVGVAYAHGPRGHHKFFERMDSDGDGRVTQEEWSATKLERFEKGDLDGDGRVTPEEMQQARQAHRAARFAKKDADGDGLLSPEEVSWMDADRFAKKDADGDGYLGADELRHRKHGAKREKLGRRMLARIDTDEDGAISRAEAEAAAQGFFEKLDADQDGAVTKAELREGFRAMKKRFHEHGRRHGRGE